MEEGRKEKRRWKRENRTLFNNEHLALQTQAVRG